MTIDNIKSDIDLLCGSTSATYLVADKIRNINIAYNDVARLIWDSADGWQYDDSNATTLPIGTTTLVHAQQDYSLPSTCQRLQRVEVKDSSGNWQKLDQLDIHDVTMGMAEFHETAGMPLYYDLIGRSLMLYPKPSSGYVTLASGMKVFFDRDVTEFAVTASSQTPGFATPFHRLLSYAAALDYLQDASQKRFIAEQRQRLEDGMVRFYGSRNVERRGTIRPAGRRRWRQYT